MDEQSSFDRTTNASFSHPSGSSSSTLDDDVALELLQRLAAYDPSNPQNVVDFGQFLKEVQDGTAKPKSSLEDALEVNENATSASPTEEELFVAEAEPFFRRTFDPDPKPKSKTRRFAARVGRRKSLPFWSPDEGTPVVGGDDIEPDEDDGADRVDTKAKALECKKRVKEAAINHRPRMAKILEALGLDTVQYLVLEAEAHSFILDPDHPERERDSVTRHHEKGKGLDRQATARAKMYLYVEEFLTVGGFGETFWGVNSAGAAMPGRLVWPEDEKKIIAVVTPLMRRQISNHRAKLSSRANGFNEKKKAKAMAKAKSTFTEPLNAALPIEVRTQEVLPPMIGNPNLDPQLWNA